MEPQNIKDIYSMILPEDRILNLKFELHRCLTFPCDFETRFPGAKPLDLANLGFYFEDELLHCQFCGHTANVENYLESHDHKVYCAQLQESGENICFSKILNYSFEAHRLYSFLNSNWVKANPKVCCVDLAADGFYFLNEGKDKTRCFYCKLNIEDWLESETGKIVHTNFNKQCPFFQNPSNVLNMKIGTECQKTYSDSIGKPNSGAKDMSDEEMEEAMNAQGPHNPAAPNGNNPPAAEPGNEDQQGAQENPINDGQQAEN